MFQKITSLYKNQQGGGLHGRVLTPSYQKTSKAIAFLFCVIFFVFLPVGFFLGHIKEAQASTYSNTVSSEANLLYYWQMNESSGATSLAATVGGTVINLTGATAGSPGQVGTAVLFNGTSNYAATASTLNLSAYNKLVVEALVYFNSYDGTGKIAWELGPNFGTTASFFYGYDGGTDSGNTCNIAVHGNAGYSIALYNRPSVATWHHVAAVYNKGLATNEVDLYVDGVLQTASSRPYNADDSDNFGNDILYLMSRAGTSLFGAGKMQHLAIYSDLSAGRILAHAQQAESSSILTLSGPISGIQEMASTNFSIGINGIISGSVTVTPGDNGVGGTFTPSILTLNSGTPTATFTYTPASAGTKAISVSNNGGLTNPNSVGFVALPPVPATAISLTGPSSGNIGAASSNFTLSTNGIITGDITITLSDSGADGTFSPATVTLNSSILSSIFTYTPTSAGNKIISISNNGGLTNPNNSSFSSVGLGIILGDSTIATYAGGTQVSDFLYTNEQSSAGWVANNIAVPGHTIAQQKTTYLAVSNKASYDYSIVEVGLNDLDPAEAASVAIARLQDLINTVNANKKIGALTIISTMTPVKQRLIDLYGSANGLVSYQKWLDMNTSIMGGGSTPITGVDYRISKHTALLDDGNGNLNPVYNTGDHVHENNAARQIIARVWRDSLASLNLLNSDVPSAPIIGSVTTNSLSATIHFTAPVFDGGSTVTSYTVTSNQGNLTATGNASPITVTGFTDHASYAFTVTATNSAGNSTSSSVSNSVTVTDIISPASFTLLSPITNITTSNRTPIFSWSASSDTESGLSKYQFYLDGIMNKDNIPNSSTSTSLSAELPCGNHSWYIKAIDNNNNTTNSNTFTLDINCAGAFIPSPKPTITPTDPTLGTVPSNITQIAISRTPDFTNISWQPFDKDKFKNIDQTTETLYVKFRTDQGAVSDTIIYTPQASNQSTTIPLNDGDIVKTSNSPDVYVIKYKNNKQYKRLILSPLVFKSYQHLKWENIKIVSQEQLDKYTTSNLVKETIDTIIYQLFPNGDTGERKAQDTLINYDSDSVYEINVVDRDSYVSAK